MTTQNEKSLAPEQASEATAQRPSTENPTAEGIVGVRAACGNQTSSKVSCADALTDEQWEELRRIARTYNEQGFPKHAREFFARALLEGAKHE